MATFNFPDSPENEKRRLQNQQIQELFVEQRKSSAIDRGHMAWENWKKTGSTLLETGDKLAIAKCLGKKIEKIKDKDGRGALTKLLKDVMHLAQPMTLKHLNKLTIKSEGKPDKDLTAAPAPYQALIQALAKYTGEDPYVLADEILLFTRFHPVGKDELEEAKLILDALQVAVDLIDRDFNLWEQCLAVAAIRKPLEDPYHQAFEDGNETVLSAVFEANPPRGVGSPIKLWWPLEEYLLEDFDTGKHCAPVNPFWAKSYPAHGSGAACVWIDEEFFFFPHIYLGPAIEWSGWREYRDGRPQQMSPSAKETVLASLQTESEPRVFFDEETSEYQVYQDGTEPGKKRMNRIDWEWGSDGPMDNAARWLVIYPDPDAKRLVPAIYTRGDTWFTELVPLSARLIAEFGDGDRWQYVGHNAPTLLQRLKDLTGFGTGDFRVMNAWRETAARFHLNPIFRSQPGVKEKFLYRRHLERWIASVGQEGREKPGANE